MGSVTAVCQFYFSPSSSISFFRLRNMQGQRQSELTAEVELLPTTDNSKTKQTARVPISMNFEVSWSGHLEEWCEVFISSYPSLHRRFHLLVQVLKFAI